MKQGDNREVKFTKSDTNAVKGIAIILLFFHHCFLNQQRWATVAYEQLGAGKKLNYFPISFAPFSQHMITYLASFSKICVAMFVFLTGYGLYASYTIKKEKNETFIKNRLITMMTGFMFMFMIVQILAIPTGRLFQVYGKGTSSIFYFIVDGLGLAKLLNTPLFCLTWWYMSLAFVLVVIFPFIYRWMEKDEWIVLILSIVIPRAIGVSTDSFLRYFLAYVIGMYFSKHDGLVSVKQWLMKDSIWKKGLKFLAAFVGLLVIIRFRQNALSGWSYLDIWDGIAATYVIVLIYTYILWNSYLHKFFEILGRHSMNMFLIHSFYRDVFFHSFTYSFRNWFVILVVLLAISFVSSWTIELLKKIFRYQLFVDYLKKKSNIRV